MNSQINLSIKQVHAFLLNAATSRPVFIWGPPGAGKSSLVEQFAHKLDTGVRIATGLAARSGRPDRYPEDRRQRELLRSPSPQAKAT